VDAVKIARCDIFSYDLPLVTPLQIKGIRLDRRCGLLIKLTTEAGTVGWGEVAPLPGLSRETLDQAQRQVLALRHALSSAVVEAEHFAIDAETPMALLQHDLLPAVRWGVEQALWNVYADTRGRPLQRLLAERPREVVSINGLLTGSHEDILRAARSMAGQGFKAVKLKVGRRSLQQDVALTMEVREIIGWDVALRLDANRAWDANTALEFGTAVAGCGIAYIEEPLADSTHLLTFLKQSPLPIALDETLSDLQLADLHTYQGIAAVVLKPSTLGGLHHVMRMAQQAQMIGALPVFSSAFETGLTVFTLAQLAAATEHDVLTGLDTYRWLAEDVLQTRLAMHAGRLDLRVLGATGVRPDTARLREVSDE
jgi:O-succinylbenzoate synthase